MTCHRPNRKVYGWFSMLLWVFHHVLSYVVLEITTILVSQAIKASDKAYSYWENASSSFVTQENKRSGRKTLTTQTRQKSNLHALKASSHRRQFHLKLLQDRDLMKVYFFLSRFGKGGSNRLSKEWAKKSTDSCLVWNQGGWILRVCTGLIVIWMFWNWHGIMHLRGQIPTPNLQGK